MKLLQGLALFFAAVLPAQTGFVTDFPITISCFDDALVPQQKIIVKLSPATNEANLMYESGEMAKPVYLAIGRVFGIYSSSSVNIERTTGGISQGGSILTITAHSSQVLRVTRYSNFSLELKENDLGVFEPHLLTYESGIDAFPDSKLQGSITFTDLSCTITGL